MHPIPDVCEAVREIPYRSAGSVMRTEFVDRVDDMAALAALVDELVDGRGGALVIEGLSGMDKSALLGRFRDRLEERAEPEYRSNSRFARRIWVRTVRPASRCGVSGIRNSAVWRSRRRPGRGRRIAQVPNVSRSAVG